MRIRAKIDANQNAIVHDLRKVGASVQSLATIGNGCPDLLVGWNGKNYLFEVKDPLQPPSKRRLTEDELTWRIGWTGQLITIENFKDAFEVMQR